MKHADTRIQDLIEAIQGALSMFTDRKILWTVSQALSSYKVAFTIIPPERDAYRSTFMISHESLHHAVYWDAIKRGLVRSVVLSMVNDAPPAQESEITYLVDAQTYTAQQEATECRMLYCKNPVLNDGDCCRACFESMPAERVGSARA